MFLYRIDRNPQSLCNLTMRHLLLSTHFKNLTLPISQLMHGTRNQVSEIVCKDMLPGIITIIYSL